jgi:hypothetical protein
VEGRFSREQEKGGDELPIVVNETAIKAMGMKDPIGNRVREFRIIGIIEEIGIRKVFGASIPSIFFLLSKQFSKWVLAANVIAWPVAYFVMSKWLSSFAYHTSPNILVFVFAGLIVLLIAVITVSYQTLRTALTNPIHSLRYE